MSLGPAPSPAYGVQPVGSAPVLGATTALGDVSASDNENKGNLNSKPTGDDATGNDGFKEGGYGW